MSLPQTAFTFDGTDDARRLSVYTLCCLRSYRRLLVAFASEVTALVSILRANDSVGRSVGLSSAACLPFCKPLSFDGTDDARRLSVYTLPCCLTEVLPRLLRRLCLLVTALVSILRANDSVGRSVGLSSAFACLPLCKPLSHHGTDDARRLSSSTVLRLKSYRRLLRRLCLLSDSVWCRY
jgi:hypothetical protein